MILTDLKTYILPGKKGELAILAQNDLSNKKNYMEEKNCKHRSSNGWCNKTQRQCPLSNLLFKN